jgi:hypothetical protein
VGGAVAAVSAVIGTASLRSADSSHIRVQHPPTVASAVPSTPTRRAAYQTLSRWQRMYETAWIEFAQAMPSVVDNDRGQLAWGHSHVLNSLLTMYVATGAERYLDRFVDVADAVLAGRDEVRGVPSHRDGSAAPAWRALRGFSQGWLELLDMAGAPALRLACRPPRSGQSWVSIYPLDDHRFRVIVRRGDGRVDDIWALSTDPLDRRYAPHVLRTLHTNNTVTFHELRAKPRRVRLARIERTQVDPQPYVHASHTGAIVTPLADFVAIVADSRALAERYRGPARQFRDAAVSALACHDKEYVVTGNTGWWSFLRGDPFYLDGSELPLNEALLPAIAYLSLSRLPDADQTWGERVRQVATRARMAFRPGLDGTMRWTYWVPGSAPWRGWAAADNVSEHLPSKTPDRRVEDIKHAAVDVDFVARCAASRVVFSAADVKALVRTYLSRVATGSGRAASVRDRVDGSGEATQTSQAGLWGRLALTDPQMARHLADVVTAAQPRGSTGYELAVLAWMVRLEGVL